MLGYDIPILAELIAKQSGEARANCFSESLLAVTRSKSNQSQLAQRESGKSYHLQMRTCLTLNTVDSCERKSRRQRLQEKLRETKVVEHVIDPVHSDIFTIPGDIAKLQREDLTTFFLNVCLNQQIKRKDVFVLKGDSLYCRSQIGDQLVIPQSLRSTILNLSPSISWGGHLGQAKTFARMVPCFYWPQQYSDTVKYCQSCPQCQLTAPGRKGERAPLINMPIIDTPFSRIAMDIIGPLERSSGGHKYILVLCDYATRYPEAFPLKKVKARQIVNCLI